MGCWEVGGGYDDDDEEEKWDALWKLYYFVREEAKKVIFM